ncbi:MAG: hypothetical protein ACPGPG_03110 [Luminiphilus sp.]
MPNPSKLLLAALGLTLMAGCGEQTPDASEPSAPPTPQTPATPDTAVVEVEIEEQQSNPTQEQEVVLEQTPRDMKVGETIDVDAFREGVRVEISKKEDNEG